MKQYLGVKLIDAEPWLGINGKCIDLQNERTGEETLGYKVVYEDGHTSWSPKDAFEKAYREINNLTFGLAIEALKLGKLIARAGWSGSGMFICKQVPSVIGLDIIPKMQSLPQAAKDNPIKREQSISYENQMLIVNSKGRADSWVPSSSDVFAEDWYIVE